MKLILQIFARVRGILFVSIFLVLPVLARTSDEQSEDKLNKLNKQHLSRTGNEESGACTDLKASLGAGLVTSAVGSNIKRVCMGGESLSENTQPAGMGMHS
jgi:hypothetical protein